MKPRKIPMRTCVVTREQYPKSELLRIVRQDGHILVDPTGKQNGKGAYLKKDIEVLELAKKKKVLDRALECPVEESVYEEIRSIIQKEMETK